MGKADDPVARFQALFDRAIRGLGHASVAHREAAAGAGPVSAAGLPAAADAVFEKVRRHAYKVTDEDIAALKAAGLSEEQIFELTIAAAAGVSQRRLAALDAALAAYDARGSARKVS